MNRLAFTFLIGILGPWLVFKSGFEAVSALAPGYMNLLLPSWVVLSFVIPLILSRLAEIAWRRGYVSAALAQFIAQSKNA